MALPTCPPVLPPEILAHIERFAEAWAKSDARPKPEPAVVRYWDDLLGTWLEAKDLPLYVRKHNNNRGHHVRHPQGRDLVPTDNSTAHWAYTLASAGICPSIQEVRNWITDDRLPVAMIHKASEKTAARYRCYLSQQHNVNQRGWKLAHIAPVGLNSRVALADMPLLRLEEHFLKLMSPSNMFVIPLAWSGLGEIEQVIAAVSSHCVI